MSFNRPMYDYCEGSKRITESTQAANYNVLTPVICGNCIQTDPHIMPYRTGVSLNSGTPWRFYAGPIDVESDLFNLNRPLTDCPSGKYHPEAQNCFTTNGEPGGQGVVCKTESCNGINAGQYSNKPYPKSCKPVEGFTNKAPQERFRKSGQRCQDNNLVDMPACHFGVEDTRLSNPPSTLRGTGVNRFQPLCFNPQEKIFFPGSYQIPTRTIVRDNHRACLPDLTTMFTPLFTDDGKNIPCPQTVPTCGANTNFMYAYDRCG